MNYNMHVQLKREKSLQQKFCKVNFKKCAEKGLQNKKKKVALVLDSNLRQ